MKIALEDLDRELLDKAMRLSGLSTYEEVIHLALRELLRTWGTQPSASSGNTDPGAST